MNIFLRTVKEFVYEEVCSHLLVVGELKGDCFNCKEIGIDYLTAKNCPKCKTEFKYISYRSSFGNKDSNFLNIVLKGKKQAEEFFSQ